MFPTRAVQTRRQPFESDPSSPVGAPFSSFGDPASFKAGAQTQAGDYDAIMKQYRDLGTSISRNPLTSTNVTPVTSPYSESADVKGSLSKLSDLATTGGYSDADIQNIRERSISPIRSIYAQGQQEVERQRALGGGYSPNFNATQAQMARDEANTIADKTTAANADIAQMVAQGKLAAASPYAQAAASQSGLETQTGLTNAEITNQINSQNADRALAAQAASRKGILDTISGQTSLYGTTPALTRTFGDQVIQAGQLGQGQQELNLKQRNSNLGFAGRLLQG